MSALLAQAQPHAELNRPVTVIVVCSVIIVVTLVIQRVRRPHDEQ
jgi:hypothetical protein